MVAIVLSMAILALIVRFLKNANVNFAIYVTTVCSEVLSVPLQYTFYHMLYNAVTHLSSKIDLKN